MKKILFYSGALVLLWVGFSFYTYSSALNYARNPELMDRVVFQVEPGSSARTVARELKEEDLILSESAFLWYLRIHGVQSSLKAGRAILQENFTMPQIAEALVRGKTSELAVTLLEGWTASEMGAYLETLGLTTQKEFEDCVKTCEFRDFDFLPKGSKEGYLFPDTYFVDPASYSNEAFVKRLIQTFRNRMDDVWADFKKAAHSPAEIVIMASIVEREERKASERPTVAGILWKRFDNGIGLGADATVLYALGRTKGGLTYEDLQTDSLYNTRKYRGLPPTAISNPSLSSLKAALYPKSSPYLYYLHDLEGVVHYAATLEEHNANKANYIR
jgi:UPF0755 protein